MDKVPRDSGKLPDKWSEISAAGSSDDEAAKKALEALLKRYQRAIKLFLAKRFGFTEHKAEDMFQGFVLEIVLKNRLLAKARQTSGHSFRSFLLGALTNHVISEIRKESARKRQPAQGVSSINEIEEHSEVFHIEATPEYLDVNWARGVISEAFQRMEHKCRADGQEAIWGVFQARLRLPLLNGAEVTPYEEICARYNFSTPAQAHEALLSAKETFARTLRSVVAEYTATPEAAEIEIKELQLILQRSRT
jgi:DNA-directed RNA polymerase specialized sigma24 family protein